MSSRRKTVLVTGGAGFMGSAFAAAADAAGHRIVVLDALTHADDARRLTDRGVRHDLVVGDVADQASVRAALRAYDPATVVHFAAESHVTRAAANGELAHRTNVDGTRVLFEAARAHGVPHLVHLSTAEVYGERLTGHSAESDSLSDGELSSYAASKRDADIIARRFDRCMGVAVVRPTIAFGPFQHPEKAVARWACNAIEGRPVEIWGDGSPVRQWLMVDDIADAVLRIVRSRATGVFNIGAQHDPEVSNLDMAHRVVRAAGADPGLVRLVPGSPRPGERRFSVTIDRITALGWRPGDFSAQLRATVQWYATNRAWWGPLRGAAEALYRGA